MRGKTSIDCTNLTGNEDLIAVAKFDLELEKYVVQHPFIRKCLDPTIVCAAIGEGSDIPANWNSLILRYHSLGRSAFPFPLHGQQYIRSFATPEDAYYWIGWMKGSCPSLRFIVITTNCTTKYI